LEAWAKFALMSGINLEEHRSLLPKSQLGLAVSYALKVSVV
jgi:hypothetical protein